MKPLHKALLIFSFILPLLTASQLLVSQFPSLPAWFHRLLVAMSPASAPTSEQPHPIPISDILPRLSSVQIFGSFTRDVDSVHERLSEASRASVVLAPQNAILAGLPRKPWEDADDYEMFGADAYEGQSGRDRASGNLKRFVEAHVVPLPPEEWKVGSKVRTMAGNEVWWEESEGGGKVIQPGHVQVAEVDKDPANGEIWVIKGILNYPK